MFGPDILTGLIISIWAYWVRRESEVSEEDTVPIFKDE
jgi:hypothetical protein